MKKLLSMVLVVALAFSLFAGCGNDETGAGTDEGNSKETSKGAEESKEEKVLRLATWVDPNKTTDPYVNALLEMYEEFTAETGIVIDIQTIPYDQLESKLVITNMSGDPAADIWRVSSQKLSSLVNSATLMPLDDYYNTYSDEEKADFAEAEMKATVSPLTGKKYMMLMGLHSRGLWYNKEFISEAPKTWDELYAMSEELADPDNNFYGYGFFGGKHYGNVEMTVGPAIWTAGGTICDEEGKLNFNNEKTVEAIEFMGKLVHEGLVPESCATAVQKNELHDAFKNGNIASIVTGSYMVKEFSESEVGTSGNLSYAPIPGKDGAAPNFANGWAFGIPSNSKKADLAWEFMKWFSTPEVQLAHAKINGCAPIRNSAMTDPVFKEGLWPELLSNLKDNGQAMDPLVHYQDGLEALMLAVSPYLLDESVDLNATLDEQVKNFNKKFYKE